MSTILNISDLSKSYGSIQAVSNLSIEIEAGQVFGLLGPNGSGKTTTLGMALGTIIPSGGKLDWFQGFTIEKALRQIGSIIETASFYPYLSGLQNLRLIADIKGSGHNELRGILEEVGLGERGNHHFRTYSLGMKQRLALAGSMVSNPKVLVLDEPTNGMDPQGIADIRNLILRIADNGTTIILASHLLDEVQKTCSHVAVLKKGKSIFNGSVKEILASDDYIEIGADDMEALETALSEFKGISDMSGEQGMFVIKLAEGPTRKDLQKYLIKQSIFPTHLMERKGSLEKKFLELLKSNK